MQILPHDEKFYDLFVSHVKLTREAAGLLGTPGSAEKIRALEKKADGIVHETLRRLHKSFVTPIDPEDIHAVISGLDEVLDAIEAAAYRIEAYRPHLAADPLREITQRLIHTTTCLANIFESFERKGLEKQDYILAQCVEINRLESELEEIARSAVTALFVDGADPLSVIQLKDIFDRLEITGDRCETLAGTIENVVAKNS